MCVEEKINLISVIIPVYGVEQYLNKCIESVACQTYSNLEIILVDDGSPDDCPALCDEWAVRDSRIKVIHKENGGLSDARNTGLYYATGEYIGFVDSDDWIEPAFYENLLQTMQKDEYDIVGCEYRKCVEREEQNSVPADFTVTTYEHIDAMRALIENKIQQVVWNKLYKRSVIEGILFKKGKYHEDEFWSYQVFGRVQRYASISYIGYDYFQRTDSIMGERYSLKRLDAIEAKSERQRYLEKVMPELGTEGKRNLWFSCLYHGQLSLKYLEGENRKRAFKFLKEIIRKHRVNSKDLNELPFFDKIWFWAACISLNITCIIRNKLRIGY